MLHLNEKAWKIYAQLSTALSTAGVTAMSSKMPFSAYPGKSQK